MALVSLGIPMPEATLTPSPLPTPFWTSKRVNLRPPMPLIPLSHSAAESRKPMAPSYPSSMAPIQLYTRPSSQSREYSQLVQHSTPHVFSFRLNDPVFLSLCANVSSKTIFAHVRDAAAPPVATTNNHPFVFGRHCFMHNGGLAGFDTIVSSNSLFAYEHC
jgi:hypothetical protein